MRSIALGAMDDLMVGTPKIKSKIKKLGAKLQTYLDDDRLSKEKHRNSLKKVLRKLKKRQTELEADLRSASGDGESRNVKKHIAVVRAMRKKGLRALKDGR
jgi:hypothetical protein